MFFAGENREALVRPDDPSFPLMTLTPACFRAGDPDQGVPVGQLFSPPYLFNKDGSRAARPVIAEVRPEESLTAGTSTSRSREIRSQIASVVMLRSDHNTHSLTAGDRYVKLAFHQKGRPQRRTAGQGAEAARAGDSRDLHALRGRQAACRAWRSVSTCSAVSAEEVTTSKARWKRRAFS